MLERNPLRQEKASTRRNLSGPDYLQMKDSVKRGKKEESDENKGIKAFSEGVNLLGEVEETPLEKITLGACCLLPTLVALTHLLTLDHESPNGEERE